MSLLKKVLLCGTILSASLAPQLAAPAHAQASASPFTSAQRYDAAGRVTGTISADPDGSGPLPHRAVRNSYDGRGLLVRVERGTLAAWQNEGIAPANWSGFTAHEVLDTQYDAMGRKTRDTSSTGPAGSGTVQSLTQYSHDGFGQLECTAIRMNLAAAPPTSACQLGTEGVHGPDRISRSVYNLAGEVTQLQVAVGTAVQANEASFTYTLNGQRASVTDGEGNRAELRYDGHGRQNRWVFPSPTTAGAVNEGDYEAYGYDAGGNRTSLRNRAGEVTAFSYDALNRMTLRDRPGSEPDVSYGHDNLGRMTSAAQPGHALSFAFDGFGRTISESGPLGTMNHSYDTGGRRTLMTGPGGYSLFFSHLDTGEISQVRDGGNGPIGTYSYDPLGRRSGISRPNGTTTSYGYDGAGRLSTLSHDLGGTAHDLSVGFSYNPAGQIVETTRSNDVYAFTALTNQSRTDSVNGLNQITQSGAATVTHDARGNTTSDGTRTFAYDSENRMTSGPGTTLSYDPLGRLYEISSGGMVRRFLHDGDNLIGEHDPATGWTAHHVSGPQVNDVLATYAHPSIARTFYYGDERGSVIAHADNGGTTTQVNRYDEYGVPAITNAGRFQYTGQAWLPEIQLYYYRARMYDPRNGRFMQVDPVGYEDQYNLYVYVRNDPVNLRDPDGEQSCRRAACPDILPPSRAIRQTLQTAVRRSRGYGNERGGQAIRNNSTGEISYRTGSEAGRGSETSFSHNRAPPGSSTLIRSHTHLTNNGEPGIEGQRRRDGQNAPGKDDQIALDAGNAPVQTIGPDVTTTLYRVGGQDYLVVDSGNAARIPNLTEQRITVCTPGQCPE